jgi:hypothetical protein
LVGNAAWEDERARDWGTLVKEHDGRAFRFLMAGRDDESHAEALQAAEYCQKLVTVYRHLAKTKPDRYLADLADSLDLLARQLRKTGPHAAGAEDAVSEAELIRRRLGVRCGQTPPPQPPQPPAPS